MSVRADDVDSILDGIFNWFVDGAIDWALGSFQTLLTWWVTDDTYSVSMTGEKGSTLYFLREHTNWLTLVLAFAGLLVAAFRVAVQRKGEPFRESISQLFQLAMVIFILATVVNLANITGDRYSEWILADARPADDEWIENWKSGIAGLKSADTMFLLLFFALFAAIASVIQFILMLFRSAILIVLVGILPVVAASRSSKYGESAFRKCIGLLISAILFKWVAATIYAAAFQLMASDYDADILFGLALVGGAVFVFPAVLRAVMPAVAADNPLFGVRQVGHFTFGGTTTNALKRVTSLFGSGGGSGGGSGSGPSGSGAARGPGISFRRRRPSSPPGSGPTGGTGQPGPSGTGQPGPSGTGQPGPSSTGQPGPSSTGQPAPSGTVQPGPSGTGQPAPTGTVQPGPSGTGQPAPSGTPQYSSPSYSSPSYSSPSYTPPSGYTSPRYPSSPGFSSPSYSRPSYTSPRLGDPDND